MKMIILIACLPLLGGCIAGSQYKIPPDAYARCHRINGIASGDIGSGVYGSGTVSGNAESVGISLYGEVPPEVALEVAKACPQQVGSWVPSQTR